MHCNSVTRCCNNARASQALAASAARRLAPDDERLRALNDAAQQADRSWQESHEAVTSRQSALQDLVAQFIGQPGDGDFRALSTQYPIALFPVRIETRFQIVTDNPRLQIRVYPDEILADSHEPSLTQQEIDAGHAYWTASWPSGETLEAWQGLISNRSAQRAAWIAIQTQPTNWATRPAGVPSFKDPPLRPDVWTRGVEARALPDRWIAQAYRGGKLIHQAIGPAIVEPLVLTLNPNANPADKVDPYGDGFTIAKELQWTIDFDAAHAVGMAFEMPIEPSEIAARIRPPARVWSQAIRHARRKCDFARRTSRQPSLHARSRFREAGNADQQHVGPTIGIPAARSEWRHQLRSRAQRPEADGGLRWRAFHAGSWPGRRMQQRTSRMPESPSRFPRRP